MSLNAAQEKFCANIVKGMTKKDAYLDAFPKTNPSSAAVLASKLSKDPEVLSRISDIKTEVRADTNTTIHTIIDELEDARQQAKKADSPSLMMKASMLKAELLGFVGDGNSNGLGPGLSVGSLKLEMGELTKLKNILDKDNE